MEGLAPHLVFGSNSFNPMDISRYGNIFAQWVITEAQYFLFSDHDASIVAMSKSAERYPSFIKSKRTDCVLKTGFRLGMSSEGPQSLVPKHIAIKFETRSFTVSSMSLMELSSRCRMHSVRN